MSLMERLGNIDKRVLFVLLIVVVLIPLARPMGLPVSVSHWTQDAFGVIDRLKSGDTVIIDIDYYVDGAPDVEPILVAVLEHILPRGVKVIFTGIKDHAPMIADKLMRTWEQRGKKYGVDYVNLGYVAGGETGLSAYARDLKKAYPRDFKGNSTDTLPMLAKVNGVADIQMFMFFSDGGPDIHTRQISQYKVPIVTGLITVSAPRAEPFVQSKQLAGLIIGLRGAAEYETLMKKPGSAIAGMDAQSMGHLLMILFIVFANLSYFTGRAKDQAKGGKQA